MGTQALRAHMAVPKQGFYQCNWDVLSMSTSESGSAMTIEEGNPYNMFGSAIESALRTDESAESRSKHHDALWQGLMTKPVERRGWPAKRRTAKRNDKGTQTDITIGIDDEVKIVREEKHIISQDENIVIKDKRGIDEGTSMWGQEEEKNIECENEDEFSTPRMSMGSITPTITTGMTSM